VILSRQDVAAWSAEPVTLSRGDSGESVAMLQRVLLFFGFDVGEPDGAFGPLTDAGLEAAQTELSLAPDGDCGPLTRARLDFAMASGWQAGGLLPYCEGGPLARGVHPELGRIPSARGRMSSFGGPRDSGDRGYSQALVRVRPSGSIEALYRQHPKLVELGLFTRGLTDPLPMTTCCGKEVQAGISFCLDPDSYYLAMRWPRRGRPVPEHHRVLLVADSGRRCVVVPTDWGPAARLRRDFDLSPGAKAHLQLRTDNYVSAAWAEDDCPIGPC
jgi:hypothetical protein